MLEVVVCIDNISIDIGGGIHTQPITIGKVYNVVNPSNQVSKKYPFYNLIDDNGNASVILCSKFKPLSDIRNEKLNTILYGC